MEAFATPEIEWSALAPIGVVVATALLTLVLELFLPPTRRTPLIAVGLLGLALAAYFQLAVWQGFVVTFGAMVVADSLGSVLGLAVLGATALTLLVSEDYLQARGLRYGEFYPLVLFASAGALAMLTTTNLMVMFIGLEMLSLALYVLSGLSRTEARSEESALKYFLLGAFASAFLLYGIALLYGAQGTVDIRTIALSTEEASTGALLMASAILILIGLAFKASLVPFHLWTPDVYQGAPTVATAYMSAVAKVAAFGMLIRLTLSVAPALELWGALLWWLSMLSMLVGNAAALVQRDAKRMLAYSSIAHAGYLTVGLASANATGVAGMIYYSGRLQPDDGGRVCRAEPDGARRRRHDGRCAAGAVSAQSVRRARDGDSAALAGGRPADGRFLGQVVPVFRGGGGEPVAAGGVSSH
jgi:NADH-quinone oxidoreductase subunit N